MFNKIINYFTTPKIEFYSIVPGLEVINPPILARNDKTPDWVKNKISSTKESIKKVEEYHIDQKQKTNHLFIMEKCPGIRGIMSMGIHLKTWQDIKISLYDDEKGEYFGETPSPSGTLINGHFISPEIQSHNGNQFPEFCFSRKDTWPHIIKIMSNWRVKISPGWQFLMLPNYYSNESHLFSAVPGLFNPEFGNHLNINIQIHRRSPTSIFIPAGTTIVKLIPIKKDQLYNYSIRKVRQEDVLREQTNLAVLKKRYISQRKEQASDLKKIEESFDIKKCPFFKNFL